MSEVVARKWPPSTKQWASIINDCCRWRSAFELCLWLYNVIQSKVNRWIYIVIERCIIIPSSLKRSHRADVTIYVNKLQIIASIAAQATYHWNKCYQCKTAQWYTLGGADYIDVRQCSDRLIGLFTGLIISDRLSIRCIRNLQVHCTRPQLYNTH